MLYNWEAKGRTEPISVYSCHFSKQICYRMVGLWPTLVVRKFRKFIASSEGNGGGTWKCVAPSDPETSGSKCGKLNGGRVIWCRVRWRFFFLPNRRAQFYGDRDPWIHRKNSLAAPRFIFQAMERDGNNGWWTRGERKAACVVKSDGVGNQKGERLFHDALVTF